MNEHVLPLTDGPAVWAGYVAVWFVPALALIAVVTTEGTTRAVAALVLVAAIALAIAATWMLRREALVVEGRRIGYRSPWARRVFWVDLDTVVDIDGLRQDRYWPRKVYVVLWAPLGRQPHVSMPALRKSLGSKPGQYIARGIRPFVIPVRQLSAESKLEARRFLEAAGFRFPTDSAGRSVWS